MTTEDENVTILKETYERWSKSEAGDFDCWLDLLSDDIDFQSLAGGAPGMEFSRRCSSKADVRGYFEKLIADWEMVYFRAEEYIAQDERVVMLGACSWRNKKTGKVVETPKADFIRFENGKIVSFFEFYDTAKALEGAR